MLARRQQPDRTGGRHCGELDSYVEYLSTLLLPCSRELLPQRKPQPFLSFDSDEAEGQDRPTTHPDTQYYCTIKAAPAAWGLAVRSGDRTTRHNRLQGVWAHRYMPIARSFFSPLLLFCCPSSGFWPRTRGTSASLTTPCSSGGRASEKKWGGETKDGGRGTVNESCQQVRGQQRCSPGKAGTERAFQPKTQKSIKQEKRRGVLFAAVCCTRRNRSWIFSASCAHPCQTMLDVGSASPPVSACRLSWTAQESIGILSYNPKTEEVTVPVHLRAEIYSAGCVPEKTTEEDIRRGWWNLHARNRR